MQCALSRPAALRAAAPQRARNVACRAAGDVPPNVVEARAWIAAWRRRQGAGSNGNGRVAAAAAPAAARGNGASNGASSGAGRLGPSKSFSDGTLLFTASQLSAVQYKDVLKGKGKGKGKK